MSSVEKVDDAAAKAAIDKSAGASVPTAGSSSQTGPDADKRPSTVSQTVVADESTASTPKIGGAAAPSASTSPNNNLNTTAASTRSPAAAAGNASTPRPRTTQPTTPSPSAKKRKGGFSLLACLPCFGSTGHEEDPPQQPAAPARRGSPTPPVNEAEKDQEKVPVPASSDAAVDPPAEPAAVAANEAPPAVVESEKAVSAEDPNPQAAVTSPVVEPASNVVASTGDPVSQPLPTAPTANSGVVLPAEETEGVTSGAVVPPGQVAASQVPQAPTPTPRQRRRRAKQQQQARSGTDGIITSVPEPGAVGGGILLAPRHDEITSSEISTDEEDEDDLDESEEEEEEEDEEQMLIARGGVGIPIGEDGLPHPLLDELSSDLHGRKCLVLDLDETLVHSSFKVSVLWPVAGSLLRLTLSYPADGASSRLCCSGRDREPVPQCLRDQAARSRWYVPVLATLVII